MHVCRATYFSLPHLSVFSLSLSLSLSLSHEIGCFLQKQNCRKEHEVHSPRCPFVTLSMLESRLATFELWPKHLYKASPEEVCHFHVLRSKAQTVCRGKGARGRRITHTPHHTFTSLLGALVCCDPVCKSWLCFSALRRVSRSAALLQVQKEP